MKHNRTQTLLVSAVITAGMCVLPAATLMAAQPSSGSPGQSDRELGMPTPGSVQDQETTDKKRDPAKAHRPDLDAQVTLGGAQYFVEGTIAKIEGDRYFVNKEETGEQVRLVVDRDTNLDCAAMPTQRLSKATKQDEAMTSERIGPREQAPEASSTQLERGQRSDETARGSGFRIGQCAFRSGDYVKAEVDDNGKVTTLKYLAEEPPSSPRATGPSSGTGELALPGKQEHPAELDMTGASGFPPEEYSVTPVRQGKIESLDHHPLIGKPVMDLQGERVGTIQNLLADRETDKIEYAVILIEHTAHHLHPIPFAALELERAKDNDVLAMVDTNKYQIHPSVTLQDVKDLSPDAEQLVKKMELLRAREEKVASERPIDRGAVGPMGESQAGGAGPSGPAGPPAGPSPQFEQEKDRP